VALPAGATVSFHVWIPAGHQISNIQPYSEDFNYGWDSSWYGNLTAGAWNTLTIKVPTSRTTPLKQLGLQFSIGAAWTGTVYVDSIDWSVP
jgi:hypothetical protein